MYYDGSISQRLREYQREIGIAHARVHYVHNLLAEAIEKIKTLEGRLKECESLTTSGEKPTTSKGSKNKNSSKEIS